MEKWFILFLVLGFAAGCQNDNECTRWQYTCVNGSCAHKELLPLNVYDIIGTLCIILVSVLANASGQGGAPLMTIILLVIFDFDTATSVSLSQVVVFAGSFLGASVRIAIRHPTRDKPSIDYEFLLLIITPLLLGTTLGVLLEQYSPAWLILALLTFILAWITYESGVGAHKAYMLENKERAQHLRTEESESESNLTYVTSDTIAIPLKRIIESEQKLVPPLLATLILLIYTFMILSSLIRGGLQITSIVGIPFCEYTYWLVTGSFFGISFLISLLIILYLKLRIRKKINVGYNFDDFDMIWNFKPSLICVAAALLAGMSSGFFSIGGGIVMSPIMLKLGLRPQVVVSTSSVLYVLTSSLAVLLHTVSGSLNLWYSLWFAGFSLFGSAVGIVGIKVLVDRFRRASIKILAMTVLLGICTIVVPAYAISKYSVLVEKSLSGMCLDDSN